MTAEQSPPRDVRGWLGRRARMVTAMLLLATVLGLIGSPWWVGLIQHFPLQMAVIAGLLWLLLVVGRSWFWKWIALLLMVFHGLPLVTIWMPGPIAPGPGVPLQVLTVNVLAVNTATAATLAWIREQRPDVVAVNEVTPAWAEALGSALVESHPHRIIQPQTDSFGIALFSRWPLQEARTDLFGGPVPTAIVRLEVGGGSATRSLRIIATHPPPPTGAEYVGYKREQLIALAALVRGTRGPWVVLGDLNATPWSDPFREFATASGLRDTRQGHGNQATWPAALGWFGIPIDHILVSPDIACPRREVSPPLGSDHRGIVADLIIP